MIAALTLALTMTSPAAYDPLKVDPAFTPQVVDLDLNDPTRKRKVPIRVFLPQTKQPAPVVLFSHGLGGARTNNAYLGNHFAKRGYVAVHLQHPGSDESVWRDTPAAQRMAAMRKAANLENFQFRVQDVVFVMDELTKLNTSSSELKSRLDLRAVGMSGHSFGAITTQATSGQNFPGIGQRYTDPRIRAAIAYSPSAPAVGSANAAFGSVKVPWMVMTGTHDTSEIGNATVESRKAVFPALPKGDKYGLVLFEAEHSAFSERSLPGDQKKRNPNHHRAILALSTAFWDAYLKKDEQGKSWLKGSGAKSVLEAKDEWSLK